MFAVVLAVLASFVYGSSDFVGAIAARRLPVLIVTEVSYLIATATLAVGSLIVTSSFDGDTVVAGAIAGVFALVGFATFYAAMAAGPMSLMSPAIALVESTVPVAVAVILGDQLTALGWVGVAVALIAALLLSIPNGSGHASISPRSLILAVVSGASLGLSIVALDAAPPSAGLGAPLLDTVTGLTLLSIVLLGMRLRRPVALRSVSLRSGALRSGSLRVMWLDGDRSTDSRHDQAEITASPDRRKVLALAAAAGLLMGVANAMLIVALQQGKLGIVGVLVGLYPLATIVLARVVLHERISRGQALGIAAAIGACVLFGFS